MEEVDRLRLVVERDHSTGANIHTLVTCVSIMQQTILLAKHEGWNKDELKVYNDAKENLYKLLSVIK
jgi:hypothetical protein